MNKLKAGIVGCGGIANNKHLPAIHRLSDVEIVAFCDIIKERADEAAAKYGTSDAKVCTDYTQLIALDLDMVYVLTPNRSHCEISVAALESGKHVLCEKPMAINYEEAQKMVNAAEKSQKLLTIGYQNRCRQDSIYLKKECEKGTLGEVYYARAKAIRRRAVPTWGVFLNEHEQGGGPLIDIGTHALDLTLWTMNNYEPAYAVGTTYHKLNNDSETGNAWGDWNRDQFTVEDSAFGFVVMKNGATIALESSWALNSLDVNEAKTVLCGTKAGADMEDGLRINYIKNNVQTVETPQFAAAGVDFYEGGAEPPEDIEQKNFIKSIRGQGELCVLPRQAATVTRILDAIYESAKLGKPVFFN